MNKTPGAPDAMDFALNAFRPLLEFRVLQGLGSLGAFKGQCGYNRTMNLPLAFSLRAARLEPWLPKLVVAWV